MPTRLELRSHDALGYFATNAPRYFRAAHGQLAELIEVDRQVLAMWPVPAGQIVRNADEYPELKALVSRQNILCDSVVVFAGMSVEAFVNWYGVVRVGEPIYKATFERMGLIPKLKGLLMLTDSIVLTNDDGIVRALASVSERRNACVHPKASELDRYYHAEELQGKKIPADFQETVDAMGSFFDEFKKLVPGAAHLVLKVR